MNPLRRVILRLLGVRVRSASYPPQIPAAGSKDHEFIWRLLASETRKREDAERQLRLLLDALEYGYDDDAEINEGGGA